MPSQKLSNISHGSAEIHLRCGGIFNDDVIKNLLMSHMMKELSKLASL